MLTPPGRGAIGVVRVWGAGAVETVDALFRPARGGSLSSSEPGALRFGRLGAGEGDEVVAVITGDDPPEVEVHGHGGSAAIALVVGAFVRAGVEVRQPSAWVRRAAGSVIEAEARVDLTLATTLRGAEILLEQADGAVGRALSEAGALVETDPRAALACLERLRDNAAVGLRLIGGWSVALAGRPNVGKSSLLNALAGFERAVVSPSPGTTRDVVGLRLAFDGWPVLVSDTAGLRESADPIEVEGVARARASQAGADLTLVLLDRSEPLTAADFALMAERPRALLVATKADLPGAWPASERQALEVSAATGEGLDRLTKAVVDRLVPRPPSPGAGVPFRPRHVRVIEDAIAAVRARLTTAGD